MVPATADTAAAQSTCSGYPIAFPSENTAVGLYSGYTGDCYVSVEATYTIAGLRFTSDPVVGLNEARRTVSGQLIGIRACLADSDTCDTWGDFGGSSSK